MGNASNTTSKGLSQFLGTDKPDWKVDYNQDMRTINDDAMWREVFDPPVAGQTTGPVEQAGGIASFMQPTAIDITLNPGITLVSNDSWHIPAIGLASLQISVNATIPVNTWTTLGTFTNMAHRPSRQSVLVLGVGSDRVIYVSIGTSGLISVLSKDYAVSNAKFSATYVI